LTETLARIRAAFADRYSIEREVGRGGMATVYLARDERHERTVAVKVLRPELRTAIGTERFLREVRTTARLTHPHILAMYDSGEADGLLYYIMPYIDGESLRGRLLRERQLPVETAVDIALQVADALAYAHAHGVIHRDVKPENILFSHGNHAWVSDFGLARAIHKASNDQLTSSGIAVGSPRYMSPEQAAGEHVIDPRSDVYTLACVLYEMLAGVPPFTADNVRALMAQHITQAAPPITDVRTDVPEGVSKALAKAMAKDPSERFAHASDFARALDPKARPISYRRSIVAPLQLRLSGIGPRVWIGAATLLLLIGAITSRVWGRLHSSPAGGHSVGESRQRLAVLYFDDLTPDSSARYIADGITEELIYELSGVNAFAVVPKSGVRQFRGRAAPLDSLVAALNVSTIVDGSVLRSGNQLRIQAQLIDARTKTSVDHVSVERSMTDLLILEREVAEQVAGALRKQMGREVRLREVASATASKKARDLVLRAQAARDDADELSTKPDAEDARTAVAILQRADSLLALAEIEDQQWLTPLVDRGWVALQESELLTGQHRATVMALAAQFADRALRQAPANPQALELRGTLRWRRVTDLVTPADTQLVRGAETDLRAALEGDSTLAGAWATLSYVQLLKGSYADASLSAKRALAEDPYLAARRGIFSRLFFSALMLGEYREAADWCTRGRLATPGDWRFLDCQLTLMRHDVSSTPNPARAWQLVHELEKIDPAEKARAAGRPYLPIYRRVVAATISARAGDRGLAREELNRAIQATRSDSALRLDLAYDEAYLRFLLGERERAVELLRQLVTARPVLRPLIARDPLFRGLYPKL
jgi:serine/threonine protein kinase/tetratricopeptide (TPR) repeat protein